MTLHVTSLSTARFAASSRSQPRVLHGHANSIILLSVPKQTRNSADELMTLFRGAHHRTWILCPLSSSAAGGRKRALTVTLEGGWRYSTYLQLGWSGIFGRSLLASTGVRSDSTVASVGRFDLVCDRPFYVYLMPLRDVFYKQSTPNDVY